MKNPFHWLTIGVCCALLLPSLFMNGMFMDGVLYASVSKNYAQGYGTFWEQFYSVTTHSPFHEQPPLMFFLQGIFFKILGYSMYTERVYSLVAALICSWLIYRCWKIIYPQPETGWLPVLFWFTMPFTFFAFINNLEECTMSVFVLAAMVHILHALHLKKNATFHLLVAGGMILLAGLTKGFQGMFLLAAPFLWWTCFRKTGFFTMLQLNLVILVIPVLFVCYAWITPVVYNSMQAYFSSRIQSTFSHQNDTTASHFHILYELLLNSIPLIIMMAAIIAGTLRTNKIFAGWRRQKKMILFFLLVAASGILPLMVTLEQRAFYFVAALPFIAIASALFITPGMEFIVDKLKVYRKIPAFISTTGIIILSGSLIATVFLAGKPKKDADKIHDLSLIAAQTGERKILLTSKKVGRDWGFNSYAMRNHGLSMTEIETLAGKWLVLEKTDTVPDGYQPVSLPTKRYLLLEKKP